MGLPFFLALVTLITGLMAFTWAKDAHNLYIKMAWTVLFLWSAALFLHNLGYIVKVS